MVVTVAKAAPAEAVTANAASMAAKILLKRFIIN
jgi:hypothetical protein